MKHFFRTLNAKSIIQKKLAKICYSPHIRIDIIWTSWTINGICFPPNTLITTHLTTQFAMAWKITITNQIKNLNFGVYNDDLRSETKQHTHFWMKTQPDFSSWKRFTFDVYKLLTVSFVLLWNVPHSFNRQTKTKNKNTMSHSLVRWGKIVVVMRTMTLIDAFESTKILASMKWYNQFRLTHFSH